MYFLTHGGIWGRGKNRQSRTGSVKTANPKKSGVRGNFAYTQPTHLIFNVIKDADHIYYLVENQGRRLCVGGDMVILPTKNERISAYTQPTHLICGTVIHMVFYHTKIR